MADVQGEPSRARLATAPRRREVSETPRRPRTGQAALPASAPPKTAGVGGQSADVREKDAPPLSLGASDAQSEALKVRSTPRKHRLGSPRRPLSAKVAFRWQDRGLPLRPDTYVAPSVSWTHKLGMPWTIQTKNFLPLFPDQSQFHVRGDPRDKLEEVLRAIVDLVSRYRANPDVAKELATKSAGTSSAHNIPKEPDGLKSFSIKRASPAGHVEPKKSKGADESDNDAMSLERRIMDQSRKFSLHLQDVWSGSIQLNESEVETVHYLIKICIMPILDRRIKMLEQFINEMVPEGIPDMKETPQSLPRDLLSFEAELEKRSAARLAMAHDLQNITKKVIGFKHQRKRENLQRQDARLNLQRVKLKIAARTSRLHSGDANEVPESLGGEGGEEHLVFAENVLKMMMSDDDPKTQIQAIQHFAVEAQSIAKQTAEISSKIRSSCVDCLFSPHSTVREVVAALVPRESLLFFHVPVKEIPPKPDSRPDTDPSLHEAYANIVADNKLLSAILSRSFTSPFDVQETLLHGICKLVRVQDEKNMGQIYRYLNSPAQQVRMAAVKALALHTAGLNSFETFKRVVVLKKDREWTVRCAICEAVANISGMLFTLKPSSKVQPDDIARNSLHTSWASDSIVGRNHMKDELAGAQKEEQQPARIRSPLQSFSAQKKEMQQQTIEILESLMHDDSCNVRRQALCIYSKIATPGTRHAIELVFKGCTDDSPLVRKTAFKCLPDIVHRPRDPKKHGELTYAAKFEKRVTVEWLVDGLVALMDPERFLDADSRKPWAGKMSREFKAEIRQNALRALVGDESVPDMPVTGIVRRANKRVLEGFCNHINKGNEYISLGMIHNESKVNPEGNQRPKGFADLELQKAILEMMPYVTDPYSENHQLAVMPVVQSLVSPNDQIRHTAALCLPRLVDLRCQTTVGNLIEILGSGRHHEAGHGPKRSVISVLLQLQKGEMSREMSLRDQTDWLKSHKALLTDIGFGQNSTDHEYQKYDEESIMEPLMEIEAKTLDAYPDDVFVAKGLACRLNPGQSGYDASHWKRRLFLLQKEGGLFMTRAGSKEDPLPVFTEYSTFEATRCSYGSIISHAIKIEVLDERSSHGGHAKESREPVVIGFFTKDEASVWWRDFQNIIRRNVRRAALEVSGNPSTKQDETDYVGRTAKTLEAYFDQLVNRQATGNHRLEEKQNAVREKLSQILNDTELFVEWAQKAESNRLPGSGARTSSSNAGTLRRASSVMTRTASGGGQVKRSYSTEEAHRHVKLDMTTFLALLRDNDLYGTTGFTHQAVRHAWKVANAGDGSESNPSNDKDKLKLDWDEYQTCIHVLAKKAGVTLRGLTQDKNRHEANDEKLQAVAAILAKVWNDIHVFLKCAAGTTQGPTKTSAHVLGDAHMKTMDYREFLGLCSQWNIFPTLLSKTTLSEIFKKANVEDDAGDAGGHECNFEEYKSAMIGIATALGVPIMCNGRNLASKPTFGLPQASKIQSALK